MKKFLIALMVCTLVFPLSGCGKKSEKDIQAQTIDKMYTDNNKLVLAVGDIYKLVYYHDAPCSCIFSLSKLVISH